MAVLVAFSWLAETLEVTLGLIGLYLFFLFVCGWNFHFFILEIGKFNPVRILVAQSQNFLLRIKNLS
jgi:hypothetical protein